MQPTWPSEHLPERPLDGGFPVALALRLLGAAALLVTGAAGTASAQAPVPRPQAETSRIRRPPYSYFRYRVPRMALRTTPRMRMDLWNLRQFRVRSLTRSSPLRTRRFQERERADRRRLERRESDRLRLREELRRLRVERPLHPRRLRTI